ncbi:MAG: hypothetical protein LUQ41_02310 [Methanomicrobiales archaeon]|nr:hypothetical protein [Methanomicrobiales archaeon]
MEGLSPRMREDGQWIVLMGFLVSVGIFFLALILNQSTIVGQTTAEGVLEFPKNDLQDVRSQVLDLARNYSYWRDPATRLEPLFPGEELAADGYFVKMKDDIEALTLERKSAIVNYSILSYESNTRIVTIHYNNGVFEYDETARLRY